MEYMSQEGYDKIVAELRQLSRVNPSTSSSCLKASYTSGNNSLIPAKNFGVEKIQHIQLHLFQPMR